MNNISLDYFIQQGEFTNLGKYKNEISSIGDDIHVLTQIVQGNLMHDGFYKNYGLKHQSGLFHYVEDLLTQVKKINPNPLTVPRNPKQQIQVCCRDYAVLLTAFLRNKNIPARARCGFAHFDVKDENWYDHWICEYWNKRDVCWKKVDAQLNPHVRQVWSINYDPYKVPAELFKFAGEMWITWRKKQIDAKRFIIDNLNGSWLIRGNLLRDFAALNKIEIEPHMMRINLGLNWNSWRLMSVDESQLSKDDWDLLDKVALLSVDADENLTEIRKLFKLNIELQPPKDLYPRFGFKEFKKFHLID